MNRAGFQCVRGRTQRLLAHPSPGEYCSSGEARAAAGYETSALHAVQGKSVRDSKCNASLLASACPVPIPLSRGARRVTSSRRGARDSTSVKVNCQSALSRCELYGHLVSSKVQIKVSSTAEKHVIVRACTCPL